MMPLVIGVAIALIALAFVLWPLLRHSRGRPDGSPIPVARPEPEGHRDAVGDEDDPAEAAVRRYRQRRVVCETCGPRPERDARYCSTCGRPLAR